VLAYYDENISQKHGRPQGRAKRAFPRPPGNWDQEAKFLKREISNLILISWVNSCNDSLFADMILTLRKSQVHCFDNMQLWACSSLNPLVCLERQVSKLAVNCSTIGLCCVTITWQQIFEDAFQVTVVDVLSRVTVERRHFGR